jgi:predicted nucleic acid-binding protein
VIAYLDSSILLRQVLGQPGALREWRLLLTGVSSRIAEVEGLRTLDRLRLEAALPDRRLAGLREGLYRALSLIEIVEVTRGVLARAAQPSPVSLGTLDAIHLSSALLWRERTGKNLAFATHDEALALGARANGFKVIGV